jgi:hypothetical protein
MNGREKSHMDTDSLPKAVAAKIIDVGPSGTDSLPKAGAAKIIDAGPSGIDSLPKAGAAKIIDAELSREVLVKKEYGSFLFESYMPMEDFIENDAAGFENKKKIAEEIALDLMAKHAEFYSEMKQEELVKRKSVLMCGKGSRLLQIDMCLDHGVESGNEALMSCSDCKPENIQGFGTCISPIPVKSPEWTHYPFLNSDGKYQCMPVLGKRWIQNDSQIYLETRDEGTVEALKSGAYLTCIYGGVITVVEVEEKEEEREPVELAPWLFGYAGKPDGTNGRRVTYDINDREAYKRYAKGLFAEAGLTLNGFDWYSYENQTGKNENFIEALKDQEFNFSEYDNAILIDENNRYWVALAPIVFDPDYPAETGRCRADEFEEFIGCRVDVILKNDNDKGEHEYVYIECVWSGDIKAHTYDPVTKGNKIYQTGHPYPKSVSQIREPFMLNYIDGSIVEFIGKTPRSNGTMSQYYVEELIVYPK